MWKSKYANASDGIKKEKECRKDKYG